MMVLKGQGASEYLILLAVVLIVAMVAISLLGGFSGVGGDARLRESQQYWSGASPFSITEYSQQNDTVRLMLMNRQPDHLTVLNVSVGNSSWADAGGMTFNGGASKPVTVGGLRTCNLTSYDVFEYNVVITYSSQAIANQTQIGTKSITGKCVEG